jgi:hypothetical protein
MGFSAPLGRAASLKFAVALAIGLLGAVLLLASAGEPASAAPLVGKDGKIHACYKVKGKAKGTLRVVRSAKVRCPRRWKKVAWNAGGPSGAPGATGATGEPGPKGDIGLPGKNENVVVTELESKVEELLSKVKTLEAVLKGVTNTSLKDAIAAVPAVEALCTQSTKLTEQSNSLRTAIAGLSLNAVLTTLGGVLNIPALPTALPAFACP